ncbi:MAG: LysR family transcriptional regulator [Acidobacteriota bacterium]|nr:LysR family transcriptional regulator [Acidobacteriota bacterium]
MELNQLRLFKDIAATRSVSKGAAMNGISQSAASQQLQELEQSAGVALLDRATRPLAVTEPGKLFLDMCRDILRRRDEFQADLDSWSERVSGRVSVASIYSVGLSEWSQLETEFKRRNPEVIIDIEFLRPERVYEAVAADRADLGLVSYPEPTRDIQVIPWRQEEMVLAVSPYHALANKSEVVPQDLEGADFIGFDEDLPIRRGIDRFLREHRVRVNLTLHFDNLQMIKEAVAHGSGVSIVPARIMEAEIAQGRLVPIPIAAPDLFRPLGIIHRRKKRFHRAAQAFLDLLQERPAGR